MKIVESWWVEELPNGVFYLSINTSERWMSYEEFSNYKIRIYSEEGFFDLELEEFLPKIDGLYIRTSMQNKDQISIYYIPYEREFIKNKKIILSSKQ